MSAEDGRPVSGQQVCREGGEEEDEDGIQKTHIGEVDEGSENRKTGSGGEESKGDDAMKLSFSFTALFHTI